MPNATTMAIIAIEVVVLVLREPLFIVINNYEKPILFNNSHKISSKYGNFWGLCQIEVKD
jgi:hypothetical protein